MCPSPLTRAAASWQRLVVLGPLRWPPLPLAAVGRGERSSSAGSQGSHLPAGPRQPGQRSQKGTRLGGQFEYERACRRSQTLISSTNSSTDRIPSQIRSIWVLQLCRPFPGVDRLFGQMSKYFQRFLRVPKPSERRTVLENISSAHSPALRPADSWTWTAPY